LTIHFSAYIATSLDGFIARSNGDLDWLFNATTSTDDHGYAEYMNGIDTIVMGRNTYQTVLGFGEWALSGKTCGRPQHHAVGRCHSVTSAR